MFRFSDLLVFKKNDNVCTYSATNGWFKKECCLDTGIGSPDKETKQKALFQVVWMSKKFTHQIAFQKVNQHKKGHVIQISQ